MCVEAVAVRGVGRSSAGAGFEEGHSGYQTKEQRERVARNLGRPEREKSQKPRELIAAIGVNKGDVNADIGSGVGFMLPYFLEVIGPGGKIYAEDIQQDFLDTVEEKKSKNNWENVETILGDQKDPKLPAGQIDLAFILGRLPSLRLSRGDDAQYSARS